MKNGRSVRRQNVEKSIPHYETAVQRFIWEVRSIHAHLEKIDDVWAKSLNVTGPQWRMLMVLSELSDEGTPINKVAQKLLVDPSFVTTQSKMLEKMGLLHRMPSPEDARIVLLFPSKRFTELRTRTSSQRKDLYEFMLSKVGTARFLHLTAELANLSSWIEKASKLAELQIDTIRLE